MGNVRLDKAASYGAGGAAVGSAIAPGIGTAIGGGGGAILSVIEDLLGGGDDSGKANKEMLKRMREAAAVYEQYRPTVSQARMAALGNQLGAFQGTSNALSTLYGPENSLVGPASQAMNNAPLQFISGDELSGNAQTRRDNAQRMADYNAQGAGSSAAAANAASAASAAHGGRGPQLTSTPGPVAPGPVGAILRAEPPRAPPIVPGAMRRR